MSGFQETSFLETFRRDPQHAAFWFSRYKFVSRILAGHRRVLEVGCGNGFAGAMVAQTVGTLIQTDINPPKGAETIERWDPLSGKYRKARFTAAYALDVLEHIPPRDEDTFVENIAASLETHGTFIVGMPSLESQAYASRFSREAHCNCKTETELKKLMQRHFSVVYMFTMNDEVIGTGFPPMAHYRIALCNTHR